jgi:cellulose synthase operon protein YhjQ
MPIIFFSSPKGGVGKTTLTSNVSVALRRLGWQVIAIDFDVQNALRLHFGVTVEDGRGFTTAVRSTRPWLEQAWDTASGVRLIPFGAIGNADNTQLERFLQDHPGWLGQHLARLVDGPSTLVVADTPPGPSPYLAELDKLAALKVAILLSDATSFSLLPKLQDGEFVSHGGDHGRLLYIVNQVDLRRRLNRDVLGALRSQLRDSLLGAVHQDEAFAEAVAFQQSVLDYAPSSVAAYDTAAIAQSIHHLLGDTGSRSARLASR